MSKRDILTSKTISTLSNIEGLINPSIDKLLTFYRVYDNKKTILAFNSIQYVKSYTMNVVMSMFDSDEALKKELSILGMNIFQFAEYCYYLNSAEFYISYNRKYRKVIDGWIFFREL